MLLPGQYCFNHLMDGGQKDSCVLERIPALGKRDVRNPIGGLISKYVQNAGRRYRCPQMSHEPSASTKRCQKSEEDLRPMTNRAVDWLSRRP